MSSGLQTDVAPTWTPCEGRVFLMQFPFSKICFCSDILQGTDVVTRLTSIYPPSQPHQKTLSTCLDPKPQVISARESPKLTKSSKPGSSSNLRPL